MLVDPLFVPLIQIFSGAGVPGTGIEFVKLKIIPPLVDIEGKFVENENEYELLRELVYREFLFVRRGLPVMRLVVGGVMAPVAKRVSAKSYRKVQDKFVELVMVDGFQSCI
jgi:hypothetical protein